MARGRDVGCAGGRGRSAGPADVGVGCRQRLRSSHAHAHGHRDVATPAGVRADRRSPHRPACCSPTTTGASVTAPPPGEDTTTPRCGPSHQRRAAGPLPARRRRAGAYPLLRHRGHRPRPTGADRAGRHRHQRRPSSHGGALPIHAPGRGYVGQAFVEQDVVGRGDPARLLRQRHHLDEDEAQRGVDGHRRGRRRVVRPSPERQALFLRDPAPRSSTQAAGTPTRPGPSARPGSPWPGR